MKQSSAVLVVLDKGAMPLSRLWCLYGAFCYGAPLLADMYVHAVAPTFSAGSACAEIGSSPPEKLQLLTHGFSIGAVAGAFAAVDTASADCFAAGDKAMIRGHIRRKMVEAKMVAPDASVDDALAAFTRRLRLLLLLKPTSYTDDMNALLARAEGESFEFGALREHAGQPGHCALIVGEGGEGKSTLAAALVRDHVVTAAHFCKAADVRRQDVSAIVRSLAFQLALAHAPFAEALLALSREQVEDAGSRADRALELLLKQPISACAGLRATVLIDALDEAETGEAVSPVMGALLELGKLNSALSFVLISRPLGEKAAAAARARWAGAKLQEFKPAELRRSSDGAAPLLCTLRVLLDDVTLASKEAAYASLFPPEALERHAPALRVLAAARQPPALADVQAMGLREAVAALPGWNKLFAEREHRVQLLHRSVREWLVGDGRVDVSAGHDALAAHAWDKHLAPWLFPAVGAAASGEPPAGSYGLLHGFAHLREAGRAADARSLLLRLPWLQATLRERGLAALLADVRAANASGDEAMRLLLAALRLSAPGLRGDDAAAALPGQLCGRLEKGDCGELAGLLDEAWNWRGADWLRPLRASLRAPGPLQLTLLGHVSEVNALVELRDGRLASASEDNTVRVWDAGTGECVRTLEGHTNRVAALVELRDGQLASASCDKTVRVWDAGTGECVHTLKGHKGTVRALAELRDGRLASVSEDNTVRVWSAGTGDYVRTLEGHGWRVTALVELRDGRLASASWDQSVRVWDAGMGECVRKLGGHTDKVTALVELRNGRLASASEDNTVRVWDAGTGECVRTLEGHTRPVQALVELRDGRLASGSEDFTVQIWDAGTGECVRTLKGHTAGVTLLVELRDGRLASASYDKSVRVWDAGTGECVRALDGHKDRVTALVELRDGRLASANRDEILRVWDASMGECVRTLEGHTNRVSALVELRGGRLASASDDKSVRVWDAGTGECVRVLEGHTSRVTALVGLRGGRLASASWDDTVRVWDAGTGECVRTLEGHTKFVSSLVDLRDGRLASASWDLTVRLWDAGTGECVRTLEGHKNAVIALVELRDGRLASASFDNTVRVWDAGTGECVRTLKGHTRNVNALVELRDGRLASASDDNTVRVWDAGTGECLATYARSAAPAELCTLLRLQREPSIAAVGCARTFVDDDAVFRVTSSGASRRYVAGTVSGSMHFFDRVSGT